MNGGKRLQELVPLMEGCQSMQVMVLSLLNCRSVNDWYSCQTEPHVTGTLMVIVPRGKAMR